MAHKKLLTREQFIELLAEDGANHAKMQSMFNAFTLGAQYMQERCADVCDAMREEASVADHGRREGLFFASRQIQQLEIK